MFAIAFAIGLVLALVAVLLGCYAAEGLELDQPSCKFDGAESTSKSWDGVQCPKQL
jgi:hypothetical protein